MFKRSKIPMRFGEKRIFSNAVVKRAIDFEIEDERSAIDLVTERTTIPTPKILRTISHGAVRYIVMDYIEGRNLSQAWPELSEQEQSSVAWTLQ
ncbi:hypothetical protein BD410DRAFT_780452 [Rickenella mellea]|uniref:Protein kinase domain-containing protein n=1 Tax=Rickenella mellea TaxID=50990 RepID=A0A4R5XHL8_9AGAM|nr:hypothetical protein BD410DRAFT_780452 [Rickenella mellea]